MISTLTSFKKDRDNDKEELRAIKLEIEDGAATNKAKMPVVKSSVKMIIHASSGRKSSASKLNSNEEKVEDKHSKASKFQDSLQPNI